MDARWPTNGAHEPRGRRRRRGRGRPRSRRRSGSSSRRDRRRAGGPARRRGATHSRPWSASGSCAKTGEATPSGVHRRADVVHEAGLGQLRAAAAAAGGGVGLEHHDLAAGAGEEDRRGQPVGPRADDHGVVLAHVGDSRGAFFTGPLAPEKRTCVFGSPALEAVGGGGPVDQQDRDGARPDQVVESEQAEGAEVEEPRGHHVHGPDAAEEDHERERHFEQQEEAGEHLRHPLVVREPRAEAAQWWAIAADAAPRERPLHVVGEHPVEPGVAELPDARHAVDDGHHRDRRADRPPVASAWEAIGPAAVAGREHQRQRRPHEQQLDVEDLAATAAERGEEQEAEPCDRVRRAPDRAAPLRVAADEEPGDCCSNDHRLHRDDHAARRHAVEERDHRRGLEQPRRRAGELRVRRQDRAHADEHDEQPLHGDEARRSLGAEEQVVEGAPNGATRACRRGLWSPRLLPGAVAGIIRALTIGTRARGAASRGRRR